MCSNSFFLAQEENVRVFPAFFLIRAVFHDV